MVLDFLHTNFFLLILLSLNVVSVISFGCRAGAACIGYALWHYRVQQPSLQLTVDNYSTHH